MVPRRRDVLKLAGSVLLAGCASVPESPALRELLVRGWQRRYRDEPGGLAFYAITPRGTHFASTTAGVSAQSHFRGASTTKTFTCAAILLLEQRGLLRVDDSVARYLPDTADYAIPHKQAITIGLLMQHRAGVFDLTNQEVPAGIDAPYAGQVYNFWRHRREPAHTFTVDELAGVIARHQLVNFAPGARYGYSDSGFHLLAKIIERVSGLPLPQFQARDLLAPNGLAHTHFVADGAEHALPQPFISGYTLFAPRRIERTTEYNYTYDPGSGHVVTTPADLARWIRRLVHGEAGVTPAQVARMLDFAPDSHYGFGMKPRFAGDVELGVGHSGGTAGYLTDAYHHRGKDITYVMQCSLIEADTLPQQAEWLAGVELEALRAVGF